MLEKINNILNIIIGSCIGVFIGHSIYVCWDYRTHPGLYAMWSAPWYTSIFVYAICTVVVVTVAVMIKLIIRRKIK